jgi:hypothetical protein
MTLRDCTNQELLAIVATLVGSHREITSKLVACLAEIEERRLHLIAGYSSMFDYCTARLGMSEGEAYRRILGARLSHRFPVVLPLLATGAVHLSALELLRDHLTEENHVELLRSASHKSKRELETLVARRFPRPDVPSRIRPARIEPLSEERIRVEFTASKELVEKLELCRDLMRHANPSGDLAVVIDRALDLLLPDLQSKRLAQPKRSGRASRLSQRRSKRIPNAARRRVFERDGLRCTYVSSDGRRCNARSCLELDHVKPRGRGGGHEPENLRVLCRAHNQLHAEQTFGRAHVERQRYLRQRKRSVRSETWSKVLRALRMLGFRDAQAQRAVAAAEGSVAAEPAVEVALRAALRVLADWRP